MWEIWVSAGIGLYFLYAFWIYFFIHRMFNYNLRYMFEPDVNIWSRCPAAARYDAVNIRRWEVAFCAMFLMPFKIITSVTLMLWIFAWVWIWKNLFCGMVIQLIY